MKAKCKIGIDKEKLRSVTIPKIVEENKIHIGKWTDVSCTQATKSARWEISMGTSCWLLCNNNDFSFDSAAEAAAPSAAPPALFVTSGHKKAKMGQS